MRISGNSFAFLQFYMFSPLQDFEVDEAVQSRSPRVVLAKSRYMFIAQHISALVDQTSGQRYQIKILQKSCKKC